MAFDQSSLKGEVNAVVGADDSAPSRRLEVELKAGEHVVTVMKTVTLEMRRSYWSSFGDVVFLDLMISSGVFAHLVQPNKDNLSATLFWYPVQGAYNVPYQEEEVLTTQYKAILHGIDSPAIEGNEQAASSPTAMDLSSMQQYRFELISPVIDQLRMMTFGAVIQSSTPEQALRSIMTRAIPKLRLSADLRLRGVDFVPPDNTDVQKQFVIPHGTPLLDMADYIQNTVGLYSKGIGTYLQDRNWWVYPLYDLTLFDTAEKTLTLINVPSNRYQGIDRTYRTTANQVIALVTGQVKALDPSEVAQISHGHGTRFGHPDRMFKAFMVDNKDNTTNSSRKDMVSEYHTSAHPDGSKFAPISSRRIITNRYLETSELAVRQGSFVVCTWNHSVIGLFYPGMPVKYIYETENETREVQGQLHEVHHFMSSTRPGIKDKDMSTRSVMLIFVERLNHWNEDST